jgi:peptide-methionine (R)-S-oxide reductase
VDKLEKPLEVWREELSETQFNVCRLGGTERAFTGEYHDSKVPGVYHCTCCGVELFDSAAKFDSGCGWPSYFQPVNKEVISSLDDFSHGMHRIEVKCAKCDAHLGQVKELRSDSNTFIVPVCWQHQILQGIQGQNYQANR